MPLRAGNLGRVSHKDRKKKDPSDRARSIAEQHEDNAAAIRANGHLEVSRYQDEESASRFARKERVDWPRLVYDVEHGNLDIVYLWEASRGSRKLSEWTDFLDLCREHKVLIHVTTHRHTYDLSVRRDRKTLIEEGVDAEDDSEKTSERTVRALADNARRGMPHGVRQYGFERTMTRVPAH
jgi:site-specific DNA recombinase